MGKSMLMGLACTCILALLVVNACTNNPYRSSEARRNIYYDTFHEEPKHLDPARAYSSDEYLLINQIYEPVVQYHYLQHPYTLVPLTAASVPTPQLYDRDRQLLSPDAPAEDVAAIVYEIRLRPGIQYQDHASFAQAQDGTYLWHLPPGASFPRVEHPDTLPVKGTRELRAADYVYQIKRLAHPLLECPIFPLLANYIEGLTAFRQMLEAEIAQIRAARRQAAGVFYNQEADERTNPIFLDLRQYDLPGAKIVDDLTFRLTLTKPYPQFLYWLAMPFFAPVPWEVDRFYTQSAAAVRNLTLDRFPVGTGPFTLAVYQPNYRIVLQRNAHFHSETYPEDGSAENAARGLLADRGKPLPFLEEAVYVLEKESVPRWNKFLQGYYDDSGISSDVFDQAVRISAAGGADLTDALGTKGIRLETDVAPTTFYYAFNMLDEVVGGYDLNKRKLRQALSIALNIEEYIQIFRNGRGIAAQSPIPPGIFGYQDGPEGINPIIYEWDAQLRSPRRKDLKTAKVLLAEAGYTDGKPLVLFFDTVAGGPESKAVLDWLRKQFAAIGVQLQVRSTDYNQFQTKVLQGNFQLIQWGWNADYPDPENFLFLLYGPNAKVTSQGENAANYDNPQFNQLFRRVENMVNSVERAALIREILAIAQADAPWIWGFHPVDYGLYHAWQHNTKPLTFGGNTLKYKRIDPDLREQSRSAWNHPITAPLWVGVTVLILAMIPATMRLYRRQRRVPQP